MINLIRDAWHDTAAIVIDLAAGALDILATLHAAIVALPLPFALMAVAGGVALFHTIDQRATRRDHNQ